MKIRILASANQDLIDGYWFYEKQAEGLGTYFLDTLFSDNDSLAIYAVLDCRRSPAWIRKKLKTN